MLFWLMFLNNMKVCFLIRIQIGKKILGFRDMQEKLENAIYIPTCESWSNNLLKKMLSLLMKEKTD